MGYANITRKHSTAGPSDISIKSFSLFFTLPSPFSRERPPHSDRYPSCGSPYIITALQQYYFSWDLISSTNFGASISPASSFVNDALIIARTSASSKSVSYTHLSYRTSSLCCAARPLLFAAPHWQTPWWDTGWSFLRKNHGKKEGNQ